MIRHLTDKLRRFVNTPLLEASQYHRPDSAAQLALRMAYQDLHRSGKPLPPVGETGFKAYSQTDEDGIIWYLLSLIGTPVRKCVEICCGDGMECNSANLIINHGWHGLLVDGDPAKVAKAESFYARHPATYVFPPRTINAWITRDNVNDLVRSNGFSGEIDVLTIDVDGMDYWLWEALDAVSPRVVVIEYCTQLGPEPSCTVPYDDGFNAWKHSVTCGMPDYAGASLKALVTLGRRKGYRMVGVNRLEFNAFFVREDVAIDAWAEPDIASCFTTPWSEWCLRVRQPRIKDLPWQDV